jgi:hypothetical protein
LAARKAEHGVNEHALGVFGVGRTFRIGDEQPVRQIDLICGQAHAFVLVHEVEHFGDDVAQFGIDAFERLGRVSQRRMGIVDDLKAQGIVRRLREEVEGIELKL